MFKLTYYSKSITITPLPNIIIHNLINLPLILLLLTMRLDIIHHNVRHWGHHKNDLSNYYLQHNPDVISINSHGLNTDSNKFVKIFSYSNLTSGTGLHSGTALLTRTNIKHAHFKSTMDPNSLYSIIHSDHGKILIFSLYRPPRINALPLIDIKNALNLGLPTIIVGDFNIKHTNFGHNNSDNLGNLFNTFANQNSLHFLGPNFKTFFSNIISGTPDLVFCNLSALNLAINITPGKRLSSSDHIPIHIQLNTNPIAIPTDFKFNLNRADWEGFRKELNSIPLPNVINKSLQDLDYFTDSFSNNIVSAANNNIPKISYKFIPAFIPSTKTKKLQLIYHQRHRLYTDNMTPDKAYILQKIKQHIDISYNNDFARFWTNKLKHLEPIKNINPSNFFQNIKHLKGTGPHNSGTYLNINNNIITDPHLQAEAFADSWEDTFNTHTPNIHNRHAINNHTEIRNWIQNNIDLINPHNLVDLNRLDKTSPIIKPIHHITVKTEIHKIKSSAHGPSGLNGKILKQLDNKSILHLTRLYNSFLSTGYFPISLKSGTTYLIPKPHKDHTSPKNYRPITLLEPLAKVLEKILNKRLRIHLENTNQLHEHQYGFRQNRSIQDVIFYTATFLEQRHNAHYFKSATCLDVEKAFDKVWWDGLVYKLFNNFNLPPLINKLLTNYLHHRTYRIIHKNCLSRPFSSNAGVPQGSALSPTLFILFTNDIPQPNNDRTQIFTYADDITILHENNRINYLINNINNTLRDIISWQESWLLKSNLQKSTVTIFNKNKQACAGLHPIRHNNNYIPYTQEAKILGVIFDNKLTYNKHINTKIPLAKHAFSTLNRFQQFHPKIRLHLFKMYVLPILTFSCIPLLLNGFKSLKKVQIFQNKHIRHAHSIPWDDFISNITLHRDLNLPSTTQTIYKTFHKHYKKLNDRGQHIFYSLTPYSRLENLFHNPPNDVY